MTLCKDALWQGYQRDPSQSDDDYRRMYADRTGCKVEEVVVQRTGGAVLCRRRKKHECHSRSTHG